MQPLTQADIELGFWRFGHADLLNFCPPLVEQIPGNVHSLERLMLTVYKGDNITGAAHKKLLKQWMELLPGLGSLKYLWITGKLSQDFFESVCKIKQLEGLWMKQTGITNMDSITQLQQLTHLFIGSSPKLESLAPLSSLPALRTLHVEALKKIKCLDFLQHMTQLEGLIIEGDMWSTLEIESLWPLKDLSLLQYFELVNIKVVDKDIQPVLYLKRLQNLGLHSRWTKQDYELAYKALPLLKFGDVKEVVENNSFKEHLAKRI